MAGVVAIVIEGDKEIDRLLSEFPEKLRRRFLRRGMTKLGRVVSASAKRRTPEKKPDNYVTGTLKRSIGYRVYMRGGSIGVVIGPRKGYGRWVVRETIGKRRKRLRFRAVGRKEDWSTLHVKRRWADPRNYAHLVERKWTHKRSKVEHPGRPYLEPALKDSNAISVLRDETREAVEQTRK